MPLEPRVSRVAETQLGAPEGSRPGRMSPGAERRRDDFE
ncbi:MAG: hypothetical protein AVDCRST_MAG65-1039 [uncultured Solirubrobacteraceae bacterium]|uniref:Uncharacterized protein n=1 Tax=uncultured Solirubrobacteraceae bacterium TaxID=1162706 RepID=A0A6J4RTF7_9ACTN|nr:MAG: hypothetical protein AVDCRST_MAG65-1039 [uncultured Solirubrobacteraceae bacterium]